MKELLPVIGVLAVASLTPGPNNLLVMQAASAGRGAVVRTVSGVLAGSLLLLAMVVAGVGALFERVTGLATLLGVAGSLWLAWSGIRLAWPARASRKTFAGAPARKSFTSVAAFQLCNPKAWVLVMTAVATLPPLSGPATLALLVLMISGGSLLLWSAAGRLIERRLSSPRSRRHFDRAMGIALAISALGGLWHVVA